MLKMSMLERLWRNRGGQDLVEYALLVAVIAMAGAAAMPRVVPEISTICSKMVCLLGKY